MRSRPRRSERGITLIELSIALLIMVVLFGAVVSGVGAIVGTKAKAAAGELGGVIRALYDSAALTGKTCRLVFELPQANAEEPARYWAECASGAVTTRRDREDAVREEAREQERAQQRLAPSNSLQELLAHEQQRVEDAVRYQSFTSPEIQPRELPGIQVALWTKQQRDPIRQGRAYLYFFPQGFTERAMVFLKQGNNDYTLSVSPLTGKTHVVAKELEVPRS